MINRLARTRMHAGFFKALGHPIRMALVELLGDGPMNVCELHGVVGTNLSNVSRHLGILRGAGIVTGGRYGVEIRYRLQTPVVAQFQKRLDDVLGVPRSPAAGRAGCRKPDGRS
jgi:DNA-binding transcriptional ArsR family regulator